MGENVQRLPPHVQQRILRLQQVQRSLQEILYQRQQLELELTEVENALRELDNLPEDAAIYKSIGTLLIRSEKSKVLEELNDRKEIINMRLTVLGKQEERLRGQLKDLQEKLKQELGAET